MDSETADKRVHKIFRDAGANHDFYFCDFEDYLKENKTTIEELAQKSDEEIRKAVDDFTWAHRWDPFYG